MWLIINPFHRNKTFRNAKPKYADIFNRIKFKLKNNCHRNSTFWVLLCMLLNCFSHVQLFATPWTVAFQAPLSLGFSRQEYWSGLSCPPPGDFPNPGIEPRSPTLQADSLPTEPPGKPKNTGVGSLSLLQGLFLTQESNWGILHCRKIFYQLSYQGSPVFYFSLINTYVVVV